MNESSGQQSQEGGGQKKAPPSLPELSNSLLQIVKDWGAVLAPIAGAVAAGLATIGISNSLGQILGWIATLSLVGVAVFLWRRKQRKLQERINRDELLKEFEKSRVARASFRGLASFGSEDFLPGPQRRRDAGTIFAQVSSDAFRFGIVSGDTGAGKSSMLRAELSRLLKDSGFAVELLVSPRQAWLDAGINTPDVDQAVRIIKEWVGTRFSSTTAPRFLIIDQFEELFIRFRTNADRCKVGRYLDELIRGIPTVRILCSVRRDYFIDFRDLAPGLAEPLSTKNTFLVRNFSRDEAAEVIRECAARDGIETPEEMPNLVANDLAEQDEVRPAELQIVCTALRGDFRLQHYRTEGGASSILSKHIALAIDATGKPALARLILRALCDFSRNAKASPASVDQLAKTIGKQRDVPEEPNAEIQAILEQFEPSRLVVHSHIEGVEDQWSLIHDYLVEPVKLATQDASTRAEDAARALKTYLAEARVDRAATIPTNKLRDIRRYCPTELLQAREAKRLIYRSYALGYGRPILIGALVLFGALGVIAYFGTTSTWQVEQERRHWTGNQSGTVKLSTIWNTKPPLVATMSASKLVLWDGQTGSEISNREARDIIVGERYLIFPKKEEKILIAINLESLKEVRVPIALDHNVGAYSYSVMVESGSVIINESVSESGGQSELLEGFRQKFAGAGGLKVVGDFLVARTDKVRIISLKTGNTVFTVPDKITLTPLHQIRILADRDRLVLSSIFEEVTKDRITTGVWRLSDGKRLGYLVVREEFKSH
jgi:hypothetical protein